MTPDDARAEPLRAADAALETESVPASADSTVDGVLMARARAGDREAFGMIVDRHKDGIAGYLARLTGSVDRAQDLAQETFVRLYEAASRYEERGQLQALIYRIATNLVRSDERRRRRWRMTSLDGGRAGDLRAPEASPQGGLMRDEIHRVVSAAVAELPLHYRVPLVLHEIEGWTVPRIAEALAVRQGTIKSRINRARTKLRKRLAPYWKGVTDERP